MSGQKRSKRSIQSYSTQAVSALLAGAMVLGGAGAAFADNATTAAPTSSNVSAQAAATGIFTDVKAGFWAEKHVYKLASQGIVVGNNGLFRPGDSVTQQEAVLMALRFMKLQGNVNTSTDVVLPTDFQVTNYYKPYVVLAFQQGLLDKTVEMAADNLKTSWGERKASREWVAELLIRALGKSAEAASASTKPTSFADDAKVTPNKRGYINTAVSLGLANGLDGNRFDPQGAVTRAQLATFFSRAEAHNTLEYDNTVKGSISALKDGKLTLFSNGATSVFNLTYGTAYFNSTSDTRINLSDIKPYTKVTVIGATYNAAYVEVTDPTPQVQTIEGTFAKSTPATLWLDSPAGYDQYSYDANTSFVDVNGAVITPSSIAAASKVTLLRETFSGANKIVKVQVTSGFVNKTATGTIQSVDTANKSITFKAANGTAETFKWEDGTSLFSSQNAVLLPADLKVGASVKYTIKDNVIRTVEVTSGVERTVQGSITELTSSSIVYKKSDGTREVKLLGTTPAIVIPNVTSPVIGDLIADAVAGDNVQITLNSSDQVTKIEVLSRQIDQFTGASVVDYSAKTQLLTVMDTNNKAHLVQLDAKTKLAYDGIATTSLTNMGYNLTEGRKVDVVAAGQRAISVETSTKYTGVLTGVNTTTRIMTLKLANGQTLNLSYPQSVDFFGRTSLAVTDVPLNSSVTAVLAGNQDIVSILRVNSDVQLEITSVNAAANKLGVKWSGGTSEIYTVSAALTNESAQNIKISDLKVGDFINVSFNGSTPVTIQTVKLTTGQVSAVDAAAGTLTVKDYTGASQSLKVTGGVKIIRDGVTTTTLGTLTTADRVEVRKDADGALIIRVFTQSKRVFSSYESASGELIAKRVTLNDTYRFLLPSNVYIHQGDTTLSVQSLKENDNIIMYFNNDVVVEIAKQ
ncbi:S-layer homology domain-containing protein [Paenibacillus sp. BAC0078]